MYRNENLIQLKNITKIFKMGKTKVQALRGISYNIKYGDFVAIMGPSGSGKSTLMNILGCLDKPTKGKYFLDGQDISSFDENQLARFRNKKIGFVFQNFNLLARTTALENTELPLLYSNIQNKNARDIALKALSSVGLKNRELHKTNQISGGEMQRVAIARALVNSPSLILADEPTGNLDTKIGKEIMEIFKKLNQEKNITIILVTHDPDVAKVAHKIIYIRDGQIEKVENGNKIDDSRLNAASGSGKDESSKKKRKTNLNTLKTIRVSLRALSRNKMRSFLTALGIIIGVGAVIAMVSIGQGAKQEVEKRFDSMGTNLLFVSPGSTSFRGVSAASGTLTSLTEADAKAIEEQCDAVAHVSPSVNGRAQVVYGNKNWNTSIQGVGSNYPEIKNWEIEEGVFFDEYAVKAAQKLCVLGNEVSDNLLEGEYPVGKTIRIDRIPFKVIGVLEAKGESGGWFNQDDVILIPYTTAQKRLLGIDHIQSIDVSAVYREKTTEAQEQIEDLLRIRHKIAPGATDDFNVRNMSDIAEGASESTKILTILLGGIASVSLLVGGIGIMNIMLVSVTERIREIGIRMSVGALERDILLQFITEAIVLGVLGGIIGIGAGVAGSKIISQVAGWQTLISPGAIALAFFFSVSVGVFFGFYPARKASKLNPIEALRYE